MTCPICGSTNPAGADVCVRCGHRLPRQGVAERRVLASRYELVEILGEGGMGTVYRAHDRLLKETVAIKLLRPDVAHTKDLAQRFIAEIKLARSVTHRNVCRIHEYGEDQGVRYISMAFVDGVDLRRVLRQQGPFPPEQAYSLVIQAADGLKAIHEEGIVHRDLKSANLMLDTRGVLRVMDFGIAKQWQAGDAEKMTRTGQIVGTPDYMSPEQCRGERVDARSDVYSLGIVFYELLTGATPFRGETPLAVALKHVRDPVPFDSPAAARLPRAAIAVLQRALEKNVRARYQSAQEFRDALERVRSSPGDTVTTHVPSLAATVPDPRLARPLIPLATPTPFPGWGEETEALASSPAGGAPQIPGPTTKVARGSVVSGVSRGSLSRQLRVVAVVGFAAVALASVAMVVFSTLSHLRSGRGGEPASSPVSTLTAQAGEPAAHTAEAAQTEFPREGPPEAATPPPAATAGAPLPSSPDASGLRRAQATLESGAYEQAAAEARAVLKNDPRSPQARGILDRAAAGLRAQEHFRSAERLLGERKWAEALAAAEAGGRAAPWDPKAAQLVARIQDAERASRQSAQDQIDRLLGQAETALRAEDFDEAIALYEAVLDRDQQNQIARMGRATAINARVTQRVAGGASLPAGRGFVAEATRVVSAREDVEFSDAFEASPDIAVTKDTAEAASPGAIEFEVEPRVVRAGDSYSLKIYLRNRGASPIGIRQMLVTATVNGKKSSGPVPMLTTDVAPKQRGLLLSLSDFLRDDTRTWSMEILIRTTAGDSYSNRLNWK